MAKNTNSSPHLGRDPFLEYVHRITAPALYRATAISLDFYFDVGADPRPPRPPRPLAILAAKERAIRARTPPVPVETDRSAHYSSLRGRHQ